MNSKENFILASLIVIAAVFCFCYFFLVPQLKAYAEVKNSLIEYRAKLARAQLIASSLKKENDNLTRVKEKIKETGSLFQTEMRDGSDVIFLGLRSAAENVEITGIETGATSENHYTMELPLKITVQGNFRNILNFCKDIESLPNLSEIRSLKVEKLAAPSPGMVSATICLIIYSTKTPEGKLQLETIAKWATGRYNVFQPAGKVAPIPELKGYREASPS